MKKVNNRKKLNNKGFTLVELLAVVVILALVMGIAASSMLGVMNSSRQNTLHSAAQTAASNLNSWIVEDEMATSTSDIKIGTAFINATQGTNAHKWICLDNATVKNISNKGNSTTLLKALGLSDNDIVISSKTPTLSGGAYTITSNNANLAQNTCSAIRYNKYTGSYEFLLVARSEGKYYVGSEIYNYAFSRASKSNESITD